jgi:hypothetical protein
VREAALIRAVLDELDSATEALHTAHDLLALAREVRRLADVEPPGPPQAKPVAGPRYRAERRRDPGPAGGRPPGIGRVDDREDDAEVAANEPMLGDALPSSMPYVVMFDEDCYTDFCDRIVPSLTRTTMSLAAVGDGGRFVRVKGAGHNIFEREPELVQETINDVLNDPALRRERSAVALASIRLRCVRLPRPGRAEAQFLRMWSPRVSSNPRWLKGPRRFPFEACCSHRLVGDVRRCVSE